MYQTVRVPEESDGAGEALRDDRFYETDHFAGLVRLYKTVPDSQSCIRW